MAVMPCTTCTCCSAWSQLQARWEADREVLEKAVRLGQPGPPGPQGPMGPAGSSTLVSNDYVLMSKLDAIVMALQNMSASASTIAYKP